MGVALRLRSLLGILRAVAARVCLQRPVVYVCRMLAARPVLAQLAPSSWLVFVSIALLAGGQVCGYDYARIAAGKRRGKALGHFATLAGKANDVVALHKVLDIYGSLPERDKARYAHHAARAWEVLGRQDQSAACLAASQRFLLSDVGGSEHENYLSLRALVRQRFVNSADALLPNVRLSNAHRLKLASEISIVKTRMREWYLLIDAANRNVTTTTTYCYLGGEVKPLSQADRVPVVEFMLPPYFGSAPAGSAPEAHARICAFLRETLDCFAAEGFAIVPRHQYWLNIANPSGNWPAVSYHTTGLQDGWLHLKDAAIPGYYRFDEKGYAGFSSFGELEALPAACFQASNEEVESVWGEVKSNIVDAKVSKYRQSTAPSDLPEGPFVFFPLQMLNDTVALLAWVSMLDALECVVKHCEKFGRKVVVKRHPMCKRADVEAALSQLAKSPSAVISSASIHDILPRASIVVTVNSGVGFEALLYQRRVITVGASEYGVVTDRCKTLVELDAALSVEKQVDMDAIKRFVWLYLDRSAAQNDPSKIVHWIQAARSGDHEVAH